VHILYAWPRGALTASRKTSWAAARQLSPAADITLQMLTAALCHFRTNAVQQTTSSRADFFDGSIGCEAPDDVGLRTDAAEEDVGLRVRIGRRRADRAGPLIAVVAPCCDDAVRRAIAALVSGHRHVLANAVARIERAVVVGRVGRRQRDVGRRQIERGVAQARGLVEPQLVTVDVQ